MTIDGSAFRSPTAPSAAASISRPHRTLLAAYRAKGGFFGYRPLNSRWSHALANCQSLLTVRGELFNTSAVSSSLIPPK
jgi:hypothetical protein